MQQLFALEIPNQLTENRDFEDIKIKLYEQYLRQLSGSDLR